MEKIKLNIILDTQKTPLEHLSSMLAVFGGFITFGKRISLKVEKAESPVYAFTDETIVKDSLSIAQTSLSETPNRYKIGYFDPAQSWTEVKVIVEDLELQHEQDGQINEKVISLAGCTSQNQALRLGRLYRDLMALDEDEYNEVMTELESQNFQNVVDLIMYIEC